MSNLYVIQDKDGNLWGPFRAAEGANFVRAKWPDQKQDERHEGNSWDSIVLRDPND